MIEVAPSILAILLECLTDYSPLGLYLPPSENDMAAYFTISTGLPRTFPIFRKQENGALSISIFISIPIGLYLAWAEFSLSS